MSNRERRNRVVLVLAVIAVGGYLAAGRWKALHPGPAAPRTARPGVDLMWWR